MLVIGEGNAGLRILTTKRAKALDDLGQAGAGGGSSLNASVDDCAAVAAISAPDGERPTGTSRVVSAAGFRVPGRASLVAQVGNLLMRSSVRPSAWGIQRRGRLLYPSLLLYLRAHPPFFTPSPRVTPNPSLLSSHSKAASKDHAAIIASASLRSSLAFSFSMYVC